VATLTERLDGGLIPAVPVPFRGTAIDAEAQRGYARWMAAQPVAGVAVWAHTGRGPHLSAEARRVVLDTWREALPNGVLIAGARDIGMAIEARRGKADALLAFPQQHDAIGYHQRLSRELPVIAFYLYQAAGGVAYDDPTLHGILKLPNVLGIKVATLDSVMTFQRIAAVLRQHPSKLLITGEDRFLGYSLLLGARAALIGLSVEGLTSFSVAPLRLASLLGLLFAASALVFGAWMLIEAFVYERTVPGYPSLIVSIMVIGGVQLLMIGIMGEYIGKVLSEIKARPVYFVAERSLKLAEAQQPARTAAE